VAVTADGDRRVLPVPEGLDGSRLDTAVARLFGLSRTAAAALVDAGHARVDGRVLGRSDRVRGGAWLDIALPAPPRPVTVEPTPVPGLVVLHDDDEIVVVDKPPGVAAHPAPGYTGPTVIGALAAAGYRISTSGAAERQGVVHRLDAGTSGVMVVAKSERAYTLLKRAFRDREVDKDYRTVVQGHPDPLRGTVDAPIDRHPRRSGLFAVVADGKPSVTHYDTEEAFPAASLLSVRLETGRTHQIRVHMAALRHPCLGDVAYGADPTLADRLGLHRQWLHAARLAFAHPADGARVVFTSPDPPDLAESLARLRAQT
jgi:23S rRNA pseudouridine1911/1915/1917 synthase